MFGSMLDFDASNLPRFGVLDDLWQSHVGRHTTFVAEIVYLYFVGQHFHVQK